jgi:uncharacterized protein
MLNNTPYIHLFKTPDNYYIYDVNTNRILRTQKDIYEYLVESKNTLDTLNITNSEDLQRLIDKGYLSSNRVREIEHPDHELLAYYIKNRLCTITLQVTQQCNMRCSYCAYSGNYEHRVHNEGSMNIEIAKKGIDFLINNSSESPTIFIGFYGGEPLLRVDFIKEAVEYAKKQGEGRDIYFHMTTNGTLLSEKTVDFLVENNFRLLISLDGPEEIHDRNRVFAANGQGTFRSIINNVEAIKKGYPEYVNNNIRFNAVLDGHTDLDCMNKFLNNFDTIRNLKLSVNMVTNQYSKKNIDIDENYRIQNKYERFKFFLYKLGKIEEKDTMRIYEKDFVQLGNSMYDKNYTMRISEKTHHGGPCIPGISKLFMDVNGTLYPCERVNETSDVMKIGNVYEGFDLDKMSKILSIGKISEESCKDCWAFRFCYLCAAHANEGDKLTKQKKLSNCRLVRFSVEEDMKNYCALVELGYNFEKEFLQYLKL